MTSAQKVPACPPLSTSDSRRLFSVIYPVADDGSEIGITESSFRPAHPGAGSDPTSAYLPSIQTFTDQLNRNSPPAPHLHFLHLTASRIVRAASWKEHNMIWAVALGMAVVGFFWVKIRRQRKAQSASQ